MTPCSVFKYIVTSNVFLHFYNLFVDKICCDLSLNNVFLVLLVAVVADLERK